MTDIKVAFHLHQNHILFIYDVITQFNAHSFLL